MTTLMEYDRVRWLRARTVEAAAGMSTAADPRDLPGPSLLAPAQVPASAFGNTSGGDFCHTAWQDVLDQVTAANRNLRRALEDDADRLDQVISCFQDRDHESADRICAAGNTVTVLSAHLHSNDSDLATPEWDDYLRATQHDRMVDYASGRTGAVVVGVDANVSIDREGSGGGEGSEEYEDLAEYRDGELAPRAVDRFEDEGFENVGDFSHGEPGEGTSSSERSIDYIWSRGLGAGSPQEVGGGPSDHDGQVVDHRIHGW